MWTHVDRGEGVKNVTPFLVSSFKRPIRITSNNFVSYKLRDVLFGERGLTKRDRMGHGGEVKNVHFTEDVFNGCSPSSLVTEYCLKPSRYVHNSNHVMCTE